MLDDDGSPRGFNNDCEPLTGEEVAAVVAQLPAAIERAADL